MRGITQLRKLARPVREAYLGASLQLARLLIRGRNGAREFGRVGVVCVASARNGITSGAALQVAALQAAGYDAELIDATEVMGRPFRRIAHDPATAYVFHSGGPGTSNLLLGVLPHARHAYRIAYWAWELPHPPKRWPDIGGVFSEIWTPSEYAKESLAKAYDIPIRVVPHRVATRPARVRTGDSSFTVLAMADSRSSFDRKNPAGAVEAFNRAFGNSPSARLVLKVNGKPGRSHEIPEHWRSQQNITLIDRYLDDTEMDALYREADVFLSLHRAEGFGLPIIEAMARGVPVVATGWSGNLQFMTSENSVPVPYRLIPVHDAFMYSRYSDSFWADPDVDAAAAALVRLALDSNYYAKLACAAHQAATIAERDWELPLATDPCTPAAEPPFTAHAPPAQEIPLGLGKKPREAAPASHSMTEPRTSGWVATRPETSLFNKSFGDSL